MAVAVAAEAGNRPHGVQRAGLDVPLTGHGGALQALAHGAVHAHQRHRAHELGSVGALPGGLQHRGHFPGADPFGTRQAGTVFHHQVRRGNALLRQPLAHHALGGAGVVTVGIGAELRAKAQEQLLGHGVVAVLVDVADHFHQVWREGAGQQASTLGHILDAVATLDVATQFVPDCAHGTGGVGGMVEQ
ncbi:hypothetical protein D3C80_1212070 [compost metagenome]